MIDTNQLEPMLDQPADIQPARTPQPTQNQLESGGNPLRHWQMAFVTFLALSVFDAVVGGALSAFLQIDGWRPLDQRLNDVYQLIYGTIVATSLLGLYLKLGLIKPVLAIWCLFLGYVEDTLFYLLMPLVNPVIKVLTKGVGFELATGTLFPESIAGWIGWIGRMFFGQNLSFDFATVLTFNAVAMAAVLWLWRNRE